jgi:hypothetical protein
LVAFINTVHDETEEKDQDQLNDLGEEVLYNKSNVASIAQMVKGTIDKGLSKRAQKAFFKSMEVARIGQQKLEGLRTRLEFYSGKSEAGSYWGGAAQGSQEMTERTAQERLLVRHAKGGQQGEGDFYFRTRRDGGVHPEESGGPVRAQGGQQGPVDLAGLLRGWGQMKANYSTVAGQPLLACS